MSDLAGALDAALRARYPMPEVRRPSTHRQGLLARMNQIEKQFAQPGDRKGAAGVRAAKAAGVSSRTWQKWRAGSQKPGDKLRAKLEAAYARHVQQPKFRAKVNGQGAPNTVRVAAEISWNGYRNRTAHRTTTLSGMRAVMVRTIRAWATAGPEAAADAFEAGAAAAQGTGFIQFLGENVEIDFPGE